jgi:hypothetical protein
MGKYFLIHVRKGNIPMDLLVMIVASSVGLGYFIYGKKLSDLHFLISGIVLMIYPYFVGGFLLIIIGIVFSLAPFITKRYF